MSNKGFCSLCVFGKGATWLGPRTILSIDGKKYTGHKKCMKKIHDAKMKDVSVNRHTVRW